MKNTMKCLAIAIIAVIGFSFAACSNGTGDNGGGDTHNAKTYTYTGTADGVMYTLKIDGCTCAGLTPKMGDNYTLTVGGKTSTGVVISFKPWVLRLEPFNSETEFFTATVSGISITAMSGTITWNDDTTAPAPTGPWGTPGHTHAYSSEWSYNETQHWHECTANDGATTDVADHTFLGPICFVCYYIMGSGGDDGDMTWTAVSNSGLSSIRAIAYGNGKFVAGDWNGKMAYSTDNGASWTAVEDSTFSYNNYIIRSIAYGGGKFVAVGDYRMAYSDDGVNWTGVVGSSVFTSGGVLTIAAVAYGGGRFVVARGQYGGEMAYSDDGGASWTKVINPIFEGDEGIIRAIAYGDNKFFACGVKWLYVPERRPYGAIAYSDDGENWTTAVADISVMSSMIETNAIAYGGGRFVAGGHQGKMVYSDNGMNWTAVEDSPFDSTINAIAYGGGRFVAGGDSGKMAYSADGTSWTAEEGKPFGNRKISAIAYGNGRFVAGGDSGLIAYADWGE